MPLKGVGLTITNRQEFFRFLNEHWFKGRCIRILEIGVLYADNAKLMADTFCYGEMVLVDPWGKGMEPTDDPNSFDFEKGSVVYNRARLKMQDYDDIIFVREKSEDALAKSLGGQFDLIYVDGDHTLEGSHADFVAASKLLAEGGILAGHDYCVYPDKPWIQVAEAAHRFLAETDFKFVVRSFEDYPSFALTH